jgi:hypothetical protein
VPPRFRDVFASSARRVRGALAFRFLLGGALAGAVAAVAGAVALVAFGKPAWWALAGVLAGAGSGAVVAQRRRWSDADVALFFDARLASDEVVTSALLGNGDAAFRDRVESVAAGALGDAPRAALTPRVFSRLHAVFPLALALVAAAPRLVPPRVVRPVAARAPDGVKVKLDELRRVEELKTLGARSDAARTRREALASEAHALAERAAKGMDRRDAQDALGKLRDAVNAERAEKLTSTGARRAAAGALAKRSDMAGAAAALRRADMVAFDAEMDRLARTLETEARRAALAALDDAREAALAHGDDELANTLDEQRRLLRKRAADSEALNKLAGLLGDAVPKDVRQRLARLDRPSPEATEALAEALAEALDGLTPEERERLSRALASQAAGMQDENTLAKADLDELARALKSKDAREALKRAMKELADGEESGASARERALDAAEVAVAAAEARVSGHGAPGDGSGDGNGSENGSGANGGTSHGGGEGQHGGNTPAVAGSSFTSRAAGAPLGGVPMGVVPGLSPATPVAAVPRPRAEALDAVRAREVGGVERSNVPREYREQVGRYFAP